MPLLCVLTSCVSAGGRLFLSDARGCGLFIFAWIVLLPLFLEINTFTLLWVLIHFAFLIIMVIEIASKAYALILGSLLSYLFPNVSAHLLLPWWLFCNSLIQMTLIPSSHAPGAWIRLPPAIARGSRCGTHWFSLVHFVNQEKSITCRTSGIMGFVILLGISLPCKTSIFRFLSE